MMETKSISRVTRADVIKELSRLGLEWGDEEDAETLVDVLLEVYTPGLAMTWLFFWDVDLHGIPLDLLQDGRTREVFRAARREVDARAAA
jgi:hypothetical protein